MIKWKSSPIFKFKMACLYDDNSMRQQQVVEREMYNAYAKSVEKSLIDIVTEECHGCQTDHPSQKQYDVCLFMTYDQQVDCLLEDVLKQINDVEVVEDWIEEVERLYPGSNVHDLITDCFHGQTYELNNKRGLRRLSSLIKQRRKQKKM